MHTVALLVGACLALGVGLLATGTGLDRDRAFYPTVMMVVAALYSLFAAMGAATHTLLVEALAGAVFLGLGVAGFKTSLWITAGALAAHGVFDAFHHIVIPDPGVPAWWPEFCAAYDVVAAAYLAALLLKQRVPARA